MPSLAAEEQRAVDVGQDAGRRSCRARIDVLDQDGAGGGAVALPQLVAVGAVVGAEEQRAVDVGQMLGVELAAPGSMSLTRTVPAAVPSRLPELVAVGRRRWRVKKSVPLTFVEIPGTLSRRAGEMSLTRTVPAAVPSLFHSSCRWCRRGAEEQRAVDVGEIVGIRAAACPDDVLDQHRAGRRAVALPQLIAVGAVIGGEEQRAVDVREISGIGVPRRGRCP